MNDTDKIVAAIFTTGMCSKAAHSHADYFKVYDTFIEMMRERETKRASETIETWKKLGEQP